MRCRGGFAMVMALFLMMLTVLLLGILAVSAAGAAQRTQTASAEGQVRELLLAGVDFYAAGGQGNMALPQSLRDEGATIDIHVDSMNASEAVVSIGAGLPRLHLVQHAHFARVAKGWRLTSADLEPG